MTRAGPGAERDGAPAAVRDRTGTNGVRPGPAGGACERGTGRQPSASASGERAPPRSERRMAPLGPANCGSSDRQTGISPAEFFHRRPRLAELSTPIANGLGKEESLFSKP